MPIRVLVVDDSRFFLRRIKEVLERDPGIVVVDVAENGVEAIEKAALHKPDIITMDIEMPVMDGITAVKKIMESNPTPILIFSSLSTDGAKPTLDALEAGALDYLPKRLDDISPDKEQAQQKFRQRVIEIARTGKVRMRVRQRIPTSAIASAVPSTASSHTMARSGGVSASTATTSSVGTSNASIPRNARLLAIGTSTGGPVALQEVLTKLPASFHLPIVLIQHMPGTFTPAFAQRLNQLCAIQVKEAEDGDVLVPGTAYLAPGGKQMVLESRAGRVMLHVRDSEPGQNYKPCVDITFSSAAQVFPGQVLAIVLTGMGADGREGARLLKQTGSTVWSQNEASCVVYGMPCAVAEAGLSDKVLPLNQIGPALNQRG